MTKLALAALFVKAAAAQSVHDQQMCHIRYFHDGSSSAKDLGGTACSAWSDNACCSAGTAENHMLDQTHLEALYGAEWTYAKCGAVSDTCARWFLAESCLYECDVNIGRYRAHPGEAGCAEGANQWMIQNFPLKVRTPPPLRPRFPPSAMPSSTRLANGTCSLRSNTTQLGVASGSENIPFEPETDNSGEGKLRCNRRLQGNNLLR